MARSDPEDRPDRDAPAPPPDREPGGDGSCAPAPQTFGRGRYRDIDWALI